LFFEAAKQSYDSFINLQTAFGALMLAMMANMFSTTLPALVAFPEERPVFLREYSAGCYSVVAYFIARLTMEICITAAQVTVSTLITYFMVGFTQNYGLFWLVTYVMALASTALGVMIGSAVSEPSVAIELLPAVFMREFVESVVYIFGLAALVSSAEKRKLHSANMLALFVFLQPKSYLRDSSSPRKRCPIGSLG